MDHQFTPQLEEETQVIVGTTATNINNLAWMAEATFAIVYFLYGWMFLVLLK